MYREEELDVLREYLRSRGFGDADQIDHIMDQITSINGNSMDRAGKVEKFSKYLNKSN